jgi:hypothetical protein
MKDRERIITDMCYTYRHDYGLEKVTDAFGISGMTDSERHGLRLTMSQIFDNVIAPVLKDYSNLVNGDSVVVPKDKEHAESLVRMGMFYLENNK